MIRKALFLSRSIQISNFPRDKIRNFCIIAHIDHGKSAVSEKLLEFAGIKTKDINLLDTLQVEKDRGITVKSKAVTFPYRNYLLNLVDTPGHCDFQYEVQRAMSACQGAILLTDALQGIQAQTISNFYFAFSLGLKIIPVINKVDLVQDKQTIQSLSSQICNRFDLNPEEILLTSAKSGLGIHNLLNKIAELVPDPPLYKTKLQFSAMLFDSWYDNYNGVICLFAIQQGTIQKGDKVKSYQTLKEYDVYEVGILQNRLIATEFLQPGQIGYMVLHMKNVKESLVGDIFVKIEKGDQWKDYVKEFAGEVKIPQQMVFAGIFPDQKGKLDDLQKAVEKYQLTDNSITLEKEQNDVLGRLKDEYNLDVVLSTPSVKYRIYIKEENKKPFKEKLINNQYIEITSAKELPDKFIIAKVHEPFCDVNIVAPSKYLEHILTLCQVKRGKQKDISNLDSESIYINFQLPLQELITDFFDGIKSITKGHATIDYEHSGYQEVQLGKLEIWLNNQLADEFSVLVPRANAIDMGESIVSKLKELLPRQQFHVPVQAKFDGKVISRQTIKGVRKDVTAKCYGGDQTRKDKLKRKQKEGKKKLQQMGSVSVSSDIFLKVIKN